MADNHNHLPEGESWELCRFLHQCATRALPRVEVVRCEEKDSLFFLHLRDPNSQDELELPVSRQWVEECSQSLECSRLERAFQQAAQVLHLDWPRTLDLEGLD